MSSYYIQQSDWLSKHKIGLGDQVKVTRRACHKERGWPTIWVGNMDRILNKTATICGIQESGIVLSQPDGSRGGYEYPYFVLEPCHKGNWL